MTTLHLIRHGRAQALADDYDQLHAVGELQARLLGAHLAQCGQRFDAVYVGPLRRQLETLRLMREAAGAGASAWPEAQVLDGLAEGPFELLFKKYLSARVESDPVVRGHVEHLRRAPAQRDAILEHIFVHMIGLWREAEIHGDDLESALVFDARVDAAVAHIRQREGSGREVAIVTSNGVIGACVRRALGVEDGRRMRVHNASVTRIELLEVGLALRAHDLTEHLSDPEHLTLL
jgi:broad specificity phosphatase PhoE